MLGVIIALAVLAIDLYIALTNAALMGLDKSNAWAISYLTAYLGDIFIIVKFLSTIITIISII